MNSTSVEEQSGIYGLTKVLGEEICLNYSLRHSLNIIILRPRTFILYWNRSVYKNYIEWAHWFWGGAVHINYVPQATMLSINVLSQRRLTKPPGLVVDGAYDYTAKITA